MVLRPYQSSMQLGRLYEVKQYYRDASEQLQANIWIDDGTVDVRGSNSASQPTASSQMTLNTENTNVVGNLIFGMLPRYLYISQNSGTTSEIVISGVEIVDLGAIS